MKLSSWFALALALVASACGPSSDAGSDAGAFDASADAPAGDASAKDGGAADAPIDDGATTDAGACPVDGGTVATGQGCGPGSQCIAGSCQIPSPAPCDVHVPGDYATIQQAITALRAANQKATVCIADGTYSGDLSLDYGGAELTLVGSSAARVILDGSVSTPLYVGSPAIVRFRGVTITQGVMSFWSIGLEDCVVRAKANRPAVELEQSNYYPGNADAVDEIDSCDIAGSASPAVQVSFGGNAQNGGNPLAATVQNNWLHDSTIGIYFTTNSGSEGSFRALHNTLRGNTTGITIAGAQPGALGSTFVSNVIVDSTTGISSDRTAKDVNDKVIDDMRDNALFGNVDNYGGLAAPGAGYVLVDPKLGAGAPPAPAAGSPLLGAGDATLAPALDYFGAPRNGRADVGAVQGP